MPHLKKRKNINYFNKEKISVLIAKQKRGHSSSKLLLSKEIDV